MPKTAEIWKPVVGYEGRYEVSNLGHVRVVWSPKKSHVGKLVGSVKSTGYREAVLTGHDGKKTSRRVHQLVLEAFVGPRPEGLECNHKNGDRLDNRVENLEWVTKSRQHLHRVHYLGSDPINCLDQLGGNNTRATLTEENIREIRRLKEEGYLHREIAAKYGVRRQAIDKIILRQRWAHVV